VSGRHESGRQFYVVVDSGKPEPGPTWLNWCASRGAAVEAIADLAKVIREVSGSDGACRARRASASR
jgi:hypothetical protein